MPFTLIRYIRQYVCKIPFLYDIGRADVSPSGKKLLPTMDTNSKGVTRTLPAFKGKGNMERKWDGIRAFLTNGMKHKNSKQLLFHANFL